MSQQEQQDAWWQEKGGFFGDLYTQADNSLRTFFEGGSTLDTRTELEVSGVLHLCSLDAGARILDCPSGYGRHSIRLTLRGFDVTGVDINSHFLQLAREGARKNDVIVDFRHGDMRDLPEITPVDAVINMFYSFGFFASPTDDFKVVEGFHRVLKPSGRFLMHTMITIPAFGDGRIPVEERRDLHSGNVLVSRRVFNTKTGREDGTWSILDQNGNERRLPAYSVRIYTADAFIQLCKAAGFRDAVAYGDWDGKPYEETSPYLIIVATK